MQEIFLGVFSGVITSVFLYIAYHFKKGILEPWLENRLYKGVNLEGTWIGVRTSHYEEAKVEIHDELTIQIDLKQSGYDLYGIFSAESTHGGSGSKDVYRNIYKIKGHIHNNYAVLEYHPLSSKRTGLGTFLMEVKDGGYKMIGDITFVEETDMDIVTIRDAVLNRKREAN